MLINDETISDKSQIVSGLNEYFSRIGRKLDQQLPAHTNPFPVRRQNRTLISFFIFTCEPRRMLKKHKRSQKLKKWY